MCVCVCVRACVRVCKQLRADIVRLKVGIDNSGANYGKILKRTRANRPDLANLANLSVANAAAARRSQSEVCVRVYMYAYT